MKPASNGISTNQMLNILDALDQDRISFVPRELLPAEATPSMLEIEPARSTALMLVTAPVPSAEPTPSTPLTPPTPTLDDIMVDIN